MNVLRRRSDSSGRLRCVRFWETSESFQKTFCFGSRRCGTCSIVLRARPRRISSALDYSRAATRGTRPVFSAAVLCRAVNRIVKRRNKYESSMIVTNVAFIMIIISIMIIMFMILHERLRTIADSRRVSIPTYLLLNKDFQQSPAFERRFHHLRLCSDSGRFASSDTNDGASPPSACSTTCCSVGAAETEFRVV